MRIAMVFTKYDRKFRIVSLKKKPLTHKVSKALATSRKTAPVSLISSKLLLTLSTRRVSGSVVPSLGGTRTDHIAAVRAPLLLLGP
jgi:hypothetical protein